MATGPRQRRSRGLYRGDQTFPRHLIPAMKAEDASPLHREQAQNLLDMIFSRVPVQDVKDGVLYDVAPAKLRPYLDWREKQARRSSIHGQFDRLGAPAGFSGRIIIYPVGRTRGTLIHECAHALLPWNADRIELKAPKDELRDGYSYRYMYGRTHRNLHHGPNFAKLLVRLLHEFAGEDPEETCRTSTVSTTVPLSTS